MVKKPLIGIGANLLAEEGIFSGAWRSYVNQDYVDSVAAGGGIPMLLPVVQDQEAIKEQVSQMDGILLSGGYDIDPQLYGEEPLAGIGFALREVDDFTLCLIRSAQELGKPVLGICKGIQLMNVAYGGTLYQDLPSQREPCLKHSQMAPRYRGTHQVTVEKDSFPGACLPPELLVNSFHHQAVKDLAPGFRVVSRAKDGVVEGIQKIKGSLMVGIQWHPEMMAACGNQEMIRLFRHFVGHCLENRI